MTEQNQAHSARSDVTDRRRRSDRRLDMLKQFTDDSGCCLVLPDANDVIKALSDYKDISLVVGDMPHTANRCAVCLLMRAYFPAVPFLLISEDNTLDQLACIHCPRNCGVTLANRSLALIAPRPSLTRRVVPNHSSFKGTLYAADEEP
jgi:hypothetical protein